MQKMRQKRLIALLLILSGLFAAPCFAHEEDGRQEEWSPVSAGPVTTWTAPLCEKGKVAVQPFIFYTRTRGAFNNNNHEDSLPDGDKKWQRQYQLFMQYGITDRLDIDGQAVYQEVYRRQSDASARTSGLGDSFLFLRYCWLDENERRPAVTALAQLKIPTGKYQKLDPDKLGTDSMGSGTGGGSYDPGLGIILTKKLRPFIVHADAVYNIPLENKVDGVETRYGEYLTYDLGIEYFLPGGFNLMVELNGILQGDRELNSTSQPATDLRSLVAAPGIGWSCARAQALLAYQRTIAGTNTDANDAVVLTVVYTF